jgi:hypothetical protein
MKMQLPCQKSTVFGRRRQSPHRLWRSKRLLASLVAISILAAWIAVGRQLAPASDIRPFSYPDRYERAAIFERQALAAPLTFEAHTSTRRRTRSIREVPDHANERCRQGCADPLSLSYERAVRSEEKKFRESISMYLYVVPRERHVNVSTPRARMGAHKEEAMAKATRRGQPVATG